MKRAERIVKRMLHAMACSILLYIALCITGSGVFLTGENHPGGDEHGAENTHE